MKGRVAASRRPDRFEYRLAGQAADRL